MDESTMFAPKIETGGKNNKEQELVKPFVKKIEAPEGFICLYAECGKEIKKGEEIWEVLTQKDIDEQLEMDTTHKPEPMTMCKDCMEEKIVRDKDE